MNTNTQSILLEINQVKSIIGFKSTTSVYSLMAERNFPKPINVGNRTKRWLSDEVYGWIQAQIESSRGGAQS